MNTTRETMLSDLPRRLEQAVSEESPSAVAGLFTEDGSFWIADERAPAGMAASGREGIGQLFAGWFSAIQLGLSIGEATHTVEVEEGQVLQSGVFNRRIKVRETGDEIEERGGYVRLVVRVNGSWRYRSLSVVVLNSAG